MCFKGGRSLKCFKVVSLNGRAGASIHLRQVVDRVGDRVDDRPCHLVAHGDQTEVHVARRWWSVAEGRQSCRVRWVLRLNWRSWSFDLQFVMSRLDLQMCSIYFMYTF